MGEGRTAAVVQDKGRVPSMVMDPLRFGPLWEPDTARVLPGVVAGVGGYERGTPYPPPGSSAVDDDALAGEADADLVDHDVAAQPGAAVGLTLAAATSSSRSTPLPAG